jgi:antitoxin ChpS
MHTTNLRKVGGSVMLAVPPAILDLLHLHAGATVGLAVDGDRLIIDPKVKPRYTLDELLAQCDPNAPTNAAPISDEDRAWSDLPPVGLEL